jgi:hypothetical protein
MSMSEPAALPESGMSLVVHPTFVPDEYLGKLEPNAFCRAWNGKREKYCHSRAGWGTSHVGFGRCRIHDAGGDARVKTGLHRRYQFKTKKRTERLDHHAADPSPLDLSAELALARTLLEEWLERKGTDPADGVTIVDRVTRIVERIEGINAKNQITYGQLKRFLWMTKQILELHIADAELRKKIFADLVALSVPY